MRVLFTTWAWPSHLAAMVPLAWAFQSSGHEVLVAVQPSLLPQAARIGLTAYGVGADVDSVAMVRQYVLPSTAAAAGGAAPRGTGKGPRALQMFLAHAEAMADDLVALAWKWGPDLVVFDTTTRQVVANLDGFKRVHGVWAVPSLGRVYASATGEHQVAVLDMKTLKIVARAGPSITQMG